MITPWTVINLLENEETWVMITPWFVINLLNSEEA